MFYASESARIAHAEVQAEVSCVGTFQILRDVWVLDLADLPPVPGIFAGESRYRRLGLRFLHAFQAEITKPVARDRVTHIEYVPTQIVSEYFRHHGSGEVPLDGVRNPSAITDIGRNVVLFVTQEQVEGAMQDVHGSLLDDAGPTKYVMALKRSRIVRSSSKSSRSKMPRRAA